MLNKMTKENRKNGDYILIQVLLEKFIVSEKADKVKEHKPFVDIVNTLDTYLSSSKFRTQVSF
jgi:hypothetical protein